jgi:hypothetical protein
MYVLALDVVEQLAIKIPMLHPHSQILCMLVPDMS